MTDEANTDATDDSVTKIRDLRERMALLSVEDYWAESELMQERANQIAIWSHDHDAGHTPVEWAALLTTHVGHVAALAIDPGRVESVAACDPHWRLAMKREALQVGALAWALVTAINASILDDMEEQKTGTQPRAYTIGIDAGDTQDDATRNDQPCDCDECTQARNATIMQQSRCMIEEDLHDSDTHDQRGYE